MSLQDATAEDGTIEECVDEIDACVATLGRYPPAMLAVALRVHLESLLRSLLERGLCTRQEVTAFAHTLEREALGDDN